MAFCLKQRGLIRAVEFNYNRSWNFHLTRATSRATHVCLDSIDGMYITSRSQKLKLLGYKLTRHNKLIGRVCNWFGSKRELSHDEPNANKAVSIGFQYKMWLDGL